MGLKREELLVSKLVMQATFQVINFFEQPTHMQQSEGACFNYRCPAGGSLGQDEGKAERQAKKDS